MQTSFLTKARHHQASALSLSNCLRVLTTRASFRLRTASLMILLATTVPAAADPATEFSQICTPAALARNALSTPGPGQLIPGRFYNPARSGQGWDFAWYGNLQEVGSPAPDKLFAIWYTYKSAGPSQWTPVWYGATYDRTGATAGTFGFTYQTVNTTQVRTAWDGVVYQFAQAPFDITGLGPVRQSESNQTNPTPEGATRIGHVRLLFGSTGIIPGGRPDQAAVRWTLDAEPQAQGIEECLTNIVAAAQLQLFPESKYTGSWTDRNSSYGGFWAPVFWKYPDSNTLYEHHVVGYFNSQGLPAWIFGTPFGPDAPGTCGPAPLDPSPGRAICMMRTTGYAPWDMVCGREGAPTPPNCATWTMEKVAKLERRGWGITADQIPKVELGISLEQAPTTAPLDVATMGQTPDRLVPPFGPRGTAFTLTKLSGLTRLRADPSTSGESPDGRTCYVQSGQSNPPSPTGTCAFRLHYMTEGAYPDLTIVRRRVGAQPGLPIEDYRVPTTSSRSPRDGLPFPKTATSFAPEEALLIGDRVSFVALPSRNSTEVLFTSGEFNIARNSTYCPPNATVDLTVAQTPVVALSYAGSGQGITVSVAAGSTMNGLRVRTYELNAATGYAAALVNEQLAILSQSSAVSQAFSIPNLITGRSYKIVADAFNSCSKRTSTELTLVAQQAEIGDDQSFNSSWSTSETSDTNPLVGAVPATYAASGGSATANIAITLPPGRRGMQPELALSYSSRSGSGAVGMGWSLSGLSSIHRCPKTRDQDGFTQPVDFSMGDRLCLDGLRLMQANPGVVPYGAAGAEYRTEIDSYARITQSGGDLLSTGAQFLVEHKSGNRSWYGSAAGSRANVQVPNGATSSSARTLSWMLTKQQDRSNNSILYTYSGAGSGELVPNTISYTGVGDSPGNRVVQLIFEERPSAIGVGNDKSTTYLAGARIETTRRLSQIRILIAGVLRHSYTLGFESSSASSKRSLLRELLLCTFDESGSNPQCLPKTLFEWQESEPKFRFGVLPAPPGSPPGIDISTETDGGLHSSTIDPTRLRDASQALEALSTENRLVRLTPIGDFDGDGTKEVLATVWTGVIDPTNNSPYRYALGKQGADRTAAAWFDSLPAWSDGMNALTALGSSPRNVFDFDNDGIDELPTFLPDRPRPHELTELGMVSFNSKFALLSLQGQEGQWSANAFAVNQFPIDVLSGRAEFYMEYSAGEHRELKAWYQGSRPFYADVDGDGDLDLIVQHTPWGAADPIAISSSCPDDNRGFPGDELLVYLNLSADQADGSFTMQSTPSYRECLSGADVGGLIRVPTPRKQYVGVEVVDENGDGIPDLLVRDYSGTGLYTQSFRFGHRTGSNFGWSAPISDANLTPDSADLSTSPYQSIGSPVQSISLDVNGDGLLDVFLSHWCTGDFVRLKTGKGAIGQLWTRPIRVRGGSGTRCRIGDDTPRHLIEPGFKVVGDVDGDGRQEILTPYNFAARVCTVGRVRVVPNEPLEPVWICPEQPIASRGTSPYQTPTELSRGLHSRVYGTYEQGQGWLDPSAYTMQARRFILTGQVDANGTPVLAEEVVTDTGITLTPNSGEMSDLYGDGLVDASGYIGCNFFAGVSSMCVLLGGSSDIVTVPASGNWGPSTLPDGQTPVGLGLFFLSENRGADLNPQFQNPTTPLLPDLLTTAVQRGAGSASELRRIDWSYSPLSGTAGRSPSELPLYEIPSREDGTGGYVDNKHFYFRSSMPVVSTYTETISGWSGQRAYQRTHTFGYREAMYNNAGRGFRGFRDILEQADVLTASNQILDGTLTLTRFRQIFPFSSAVECRVVATSSSYAPLLDCQPPDEDSESANATSHLRHEIGSKSFPILPGLSVQRLSIESNTYQALPTGSSTVQVVPAQMQTFRFDPVANEKTTRTTRTFSGYSQYGDPAVSTIEVRDYVSGTRGQIVTTSSSETSYIDTVTPSTWWVGRPRALSTIRTIDDASRPSAVAAPNLRSTTAWAFDPVTRLPVCEMTAVGAVNFSDANLASCSGDGGVVGWESTTRNAYDVFGNVSSAKIDFRGGQSARTTSSQWCVAGPCTAADTGNSNAGYFALQVQNPAEHKTCVGYDARSGQPQTTQRLMTSAASCGAAAGLVEVATFDRLGREVRRDFPSAIEAGTGRTLSAQPSRHTAYKWCNSSECSSLAHASTRAVVEQQGNPKTTRFFDAEGRALGERVAGFGSAQTISSSTVFDDFGRVVFASVPSYGTPTFGTSSVYDRYGRLAAKWSRRSRLDGTAGETIQLATYFYRGLSTDVVVQSCTSIKLGPAPHDVPQCLGEYGETLSMNRTVDSAGKVLQTIDALNGSTMFWYDALGNAVGISDPASQITRATYDDLGRRTQSVDPNQGTWTFTYNGLGELISQTDARNWTTSFVRDAIGRVTERNWTEVSSANGLVQTEYGKDEWIYDSIGDGLLASESRTFQRGSASPRAQREFLRTYSSDELYRTKRTTTTISPDGTSESFLTEQRYDTRFGRIKQVIHPGGVSVAYRYNARGYPSGEALAEDAANSMRYLRRIDAMDPFGEPTQISLANGQQQRVVTRDATTGWPLRICAGAGNMNCTESGVSNRALDVAYQYDGFGNLSGATHAGLRPTAGVSVITEQYQYDSLHRLRAIVGPSSVNYDYTSTGNLAYKSDFSLARSDAYSYGSGNTGAAGDAGPNAVTQVKLASLGAGNDGEADRCPVGATNRAYFWYDNNGNQSGRQYHCSAYSFASSWVFSYTIDNLPKQIARVSSSPGIEPSSTVIPAPNDLTRFKYSPDGQRNWQEVSFDALNVRRTIYVGAYERDITIGPFDSTEHRYALAPGVISIRRENDTNNRTGVYYNHTDRLGSTSTITRAEGTVVSQSGFDPFGMPRSGDWARPAFGWTLASTLNGAGLTNPPITRRGFTDHEQLDNARLTHMNGRLYDYRLGRFLGVDPIIQFPTNSQSLNPYSYIMNNPLAGTDPTGYASLPSHNRQLDEDRRRAGTAFIGALFGGPSQQTNGAERNQVSGTTNSPDISAALIMGLSSRPTQCTTGDPAGMGTYQAVGVHRPLTSGEALISFWNLGVRELPLGEGGKMITRFLAEDGIHAAGQTLDGNYLNAAVSAAFLLFKPAKAADKALGTADSADTLVIDAYNTLSKNAQIPGQAHHLNQAAAFGDVIQRSTGQSIKLEGNILTDAGAPHTLAHQSLELFWNQFRGGASVPTNLHYSRALQDSLRAAGLSDTQVQQAVRAATRERVQNGLLGGMEVPRVPRPIRNIAE